MTKSKKRMAIIISGRGSNMAAIIDAAAAGDINAEVVLVVSNNPDAKGLDRAARLGVKTAVVNPKDFSSKDDYEHALCRVIEKANVDVIALAGYMKILGPTLIHAFKHRILNIHPSLLPKYKGLHAQKQALDAGDTESGCTVHFVDESLDGGPIIIQDRVPVYDTDTEESLSARILEREHPLYCRALHLFCDDRLQIQDGIVKIVS